MLSASFAVEPNESFAQLDDSGVIRRIDVAELVVRFSRDGIAAIEAGVRIGGIGHTTCLTDDLIAVFISLYWTWSEAHGRFLSFARPL